MSTTTITSTERPEIFDHELETPAAPPRTTSEEHDRMLDYVLAESREQRARERRREEQRAAAHRRRTRGALATGTVAIVIAVGGTLFFLEGPSHGTGPQSSAGTPAAAIQPASSGSQDTPAAPVAPAAASVTPAVAPISPTTSVPASNVTPATPAPGPSGNNTGNMGTGPNTQIPSGNNTGNMGSNGGPLNGSVSQ